MRCFRCSRVVSGTLSRFLGARCLLMAVQLQEIPSCWLRAVQGTLTLEHLALTAYLEESVTLTKIA